MVFKKAPRRRRFASIRRRIRRKRGPIPILPVLGGVVAPMAIALQKSNFVADVQTDPMKAISGLVDQIGQRYTGFSFLYSEANPGFHSEWIIPTYTGLAAGYAGHMIANKLGVNRQIAKVPFVGKHIQL